MKSRLERHLVGLISGKAPNCGFCLCTFLPVASTSCHRSPVKSRRLGSRMAKNAVEFVINSVFQQLQVGIISLHVRIRPCFKLVVCSSVFFCFLRVCLFRRPLSRVFGSVSDSSLSCLLVFVLVEFSFFLRSLIGIEHMPPPAIPSRPVYLPLLSLVSAPSLVLVQMVATENVGYILYFSAVLFLFSPRMCCVGASQSDSGFRPFSSRGVLWLRIFVLQLSCLLQRPECYSRYAKE